jgi:hypothetical protein
MGFIKDNMICLHSMSIFMEGQAVTILCDYCNINTVNIFQAEDEFVHNVGRIKQALTFVV